MANEPNTETMVSGEVEQVRDRLGQGEFFVNGDTFDLIFRPGGGSYTGADKIVARMACGETAYWLPAAVATLLNDALGHRQLGISQAQRTGQGGEVVAPKPVAWMYERGKPFANRYYHEERTPAYMESGFGDWTETPLYTSPPTSGEPDRLSGDELREALELVVNADAGPQATAAFAHARKLLMRLETTPPTSDEADPDLARLLAAADAGRSGVDFGSLSDEEIKQLLGRTTTKPPPHEYGRIHTDGSRSGGQPLTSDADVVERASLALAKSWSLRFRGNDHEYNIYLDDHLRNHVRTVLAAIQGEQP